MRLKMLRVMSRVPRLKRKTTWAVLLLLLVLCSSLALLFHSASSQGLRVYDIQMETAGPTSAASGPSDKPGPSSNPFRQVRGLQIFLYSAVANEREPSPGEVNIIITAFDSTGTDTLTCCMVTDSPLPNNRNRKLYTVEASVFYKFYVEEIAGPFLELFKNTPTRAKQYACVMPSLGLKVTQVTLTTLVCPVAEDQYLSVIYPKPVPGGLALCGKTAFGDQLDAVKLVEWFEVQRLLGVDHIQLMDLHTPPPIAAVMRHYTSLGLLTALPYHLPGQPQGRGLDIGHMVSDQFSHDETFSILDCTQRLRGYTYIISHDLDEVIMPRQEISLKDFFREQFLKRPDAAGFFFYTEFFVYDWGPSNTDSNVTYFRFLTSTLPHDECKKYVYLSSRVFQGRTHTFTERNPYQKYYLPKEDVILHHYRKCPHVWSTCFPTRIVDESMLRYEKVLEERVKEARNAIGV